jgi:senataxin
MQDPNQLPPTTISQDVERFHYNESLFVRIAKRDKANMHLLRCATDFYMGRADNVVSNIECTPSSLNSHQKSSMMVNSKMEKIWLEKLRLYGIVVTCMAAAAVELYSGLERDFADKVNLSLRIGVISMYKEQVGELKRTFTRTYGEDILQKIE